MKRCAHVIIFIMLTGSILHAQSLRIKEKTSEPVETLGTNFIQVLNSENYELFRNSLLLTKADYDWYVAYKIPDSEKADNPEHYGPIDEGSVIQNQDMVIAPLKSMIAEMKSEGLSPYNFKLLDVGYIPDSRDVMISHAVQILLSYKTSTSNRIFKVVVPCMKGEESVRIIDEIYYDEITVDD